MQGSNKLLFNIMNRYELPSPEKNENSSGVQDTKKILFTQ